MNCGVDLTSPQGAFDACLAVLYAIPDWALKLAYGVATFSLFLLAIVLVMMLITKLK